MTGTKDALDHPERFGTVEHALAELGVDGEDLASADAYVQRLASPAVVAVEESLINYRSVQDGPPVDVEALIPVEKELPFVFVEGSRPLDDDEIALRPVTARALGVGMGDSLTLTGDATRPAQQFRVSGVVLPSYNPVWTMVARAGYDCLFEIYSTRSVHVAFRDRATAEDLARQLNEEIISSLPGAEVHLRSAAE